MSAKHKAHKQHAVGVPLQRSQLHECWVCHRWVELCGGISVYAATTRAHRCNERNQQRKEPKQ
jgi:hypothetical protein